MAAEKVPNGKLAELRAVPELVLPDGRLAVSYAELARLVGCSPGLIRLEVARKNLRPLRIGRRRMVAVSEVQRYLAVMREQPGR